MWSCVIWGFHEEVDEICDILGYYTVISCNFLPMFRDKLSFPLIGGSKTFVRICHYSLCNNPEESISQMWGPLFVALKGIFVTLIVSHWTLSTHWFNICPLFPLQSSVWLQSYQSSLIIIRFPLPIISGSI
jgi:hypothetical protein